MVTIPNPQATKSEKGTPEFGKSVAEYIYQSGINDYYSYYSNRRVIIDNRLWAEGGQSIDDFKDDLDIGGDVAWLNNNFQIPSPLPKFANLFQGTLTNRSYKIVVEAMDNQSKSEKDEEYARLKRKMILAPYADKIKELGIDIDTENAPESEEEIEDELELNFKVPVEEALEICARDVFEASGHEEIQRKVALDIFENNAGATKTYMDNGHRKFRYVDIANLITSYCSYDDYRDMYFVGEVVTMSIADASVKYPDKLTNEEWANVASNYSGKLGNISFGIDDYYAGKVSIDQIRSMTVNVLDFQWKTSNKYSWKDKKTKSGTRVYDSVSDEYDQKGKHNVKVISKELVDIYEGCWIVDSNHLLSWGLKPNMIRKMSNGELSGDTEFDYTIYKPNSRNMTNKSLTELIKPHAKNIIVYNLVIMHMVANARPAGAAVDAASLGALAKGLGDPTQATTDPMEIYSAYNQTGVMVYSSIREDGSYIQNTRPIEPLDGGVSNGIQNLLVLRQAELQEIYNISGFNPAVDGSAPQKDALVGIEKMRTNSFNLTMKPYADALNHIIAKTAEKITEQEKDMIVADKSYAEKVSRKIGKDKVDVIKLIKSAKLSELSVYTNYEPEQEDEMQFTEFLNLALSQNQINVPDAINAKEIAKTSVKGAISYLKKAIKQKQKQDQEASASNIQAAQQEQMASAKMAFEAKMQELQAEWGLKTQYMVTEKKLEAAMRKDEEIDKRITEVLKGQIKEALIEESMFPDSSDNKVKDRVSGESNAEGRVRKSVSKGMPQKPSGAVSRRAGGSPRVIPRPADNAQQNLANNS